MFSPKILLETGEFSSTSFSSDVFLWEASVLDKLVLLYSRRSSYKTVFNSGCCVRTGLEMPCSWRVINSVQWGVGLCGGMEREVGAAVVAPCQALCGALNQSKAVSHSQLRDNLAASLSSTALLRLFSLGRSPTTWKHLRPVDPLVRTTQAPQNLYIGAFSPHYPQGKSA